MLQVKNLTKIYETKSGVKTQALNGVTVDLGERGLTFLLGKSGSGKSTLLNLLGGIDSPTEGEIIIDGVSSQNFKARDFDSYRNTYVGFVFQEYNLISEYTVGVNVGLAFELQGRKANRAEIEDILRRVELVDGEGNTLFERKINELSGGQKQRVAIARALVKDPKIILADEPTGALDVTTGEGLYELLKELSKERLVLVVTHDIESARKYGDRILRISDGEIIADTEVETPARQKTAEKSRFARKRLSFKRILAMGASALKAKPFRLVLSIILAVFSIAIFGFSFSLSFINENRIKLELFYRDGNQMVRLRYVQFIEPKIEDGDEPEIVEKWNLINDFNKASNLMRYCRVGEMLSKILGPQKTGQNQWHNERDVYDEIITKGGPYVEIDPVTGYEDANLRPDDRLEDKSLCRLPQTDTEIGIPDIIADAILKFGLRDEDGSVLKFEKVDELIGQKFGGYTICGVYSTENDRDYFLQFSGVAIKDLSEVADKHIYPLIWGMVTDVVVPWTNCYIKYDANRDEREFVEPKTILIKLTGDMNTDLKFLDRFTQLGGVVPSAYDEYLAPYYFFQKYLAYPAKIVAAVFAVFSGLLLLNFLTVSLDFKKKEIGILRALGASKRDVVSICLVESGIIAIVNFIISLIAVGIACAIGNNSFLIPMFSLNFLSILAMFALCFGVAAIVTILPAYRIASKKPIDIINGK